MDTEVKKINATKRELRVSVDKEKIKTKLDEIYEHLGKDAKIPGYRPGKVPRNILEKHFSAAAREQLLKELIQESYQGAIEKENLDVIDIPEIADIDFKDDLLKFKATVEVRPEINITSYKGLEIKRQVSKVTPEEIEKILTSIKEERKQELDEKTIKSLGYANLDELKQVLEKQLFIQKENQMRLDLENQIIDQLLKNAQFNVPQTLVKRRLEELVHHAKHDLESRGIPKDKIDTYEKEMREKMLKEAEEQVKVFLILEEISRRENIGVGNNQMPRLVMEFLLKEADWQSDTRP
ncbi:MAG: trigger factor [Candidatus Omnitrophota bacterium]